MPRRLIICLTLLLLHITPGVAQERVRRAAKNIIIVENDSLTRAMEPFGGSAEAATAYAEVVNQYRARLDTAVRIYCMPIPNAVAFYCPDTAKFWSSDEHRAIHAITERLAQGVTGIDLIPVLQDHAEEPIYLRTDHHWAPLAAYYAAREFAQTAGLPFKDLDQYDMHTLHGFVGTMAKFSRDPAVKRWPEDFVYYTPRDVEYQTTHITYSNVRVRSRGRRYHTVLRASQPKPAEFFRTFPDSSAAAYSTFMGGDLNTTSVRTATNNDRRLLLLKDSYGNALPGYLFSTFEEIHVVDCRYFLQNIIQFARDHAITDVLFANNLIHAYSPKISSNYERYLIQKK